MPSVPRSSVTTALYVTAIAILLALLSWVWSMPAIGLASAAQPRPSSSASTAWCDQLVGPARAYCLPGPSEPAAAHAARAHHDAQARIHVLIPATLAVAAAVGLVMVAGRREP